MKASRRRGLPIQQLPQIDFQRGRDGAEHPQARVIHATLDLALIGPVDAHFVSERLLREPMSSAQGPYAGCKHLAALIEQ